LNLKPSTAVRNRKARPTDKGEKEAFEMAASLLIEQESGTYIGRIRHPHDGYFAGEFSQTSRWASELRVSYTQRRDVPRADAPHGAHPLAPRPPSQSRSSVGADRLGSTLISVEVIGTPL
jgi:hypothetical protein